MVLVICAIILYFVSVVLFAFYISYAFSIIRKSSKGSNRSILNVFPSEISTMTDNKGRVLSTSLAVSAFFVNLIASLIYFNSLFYFDTVFGASYILSAVVIIVSTIVQLFCGASTIYFNLDKIKTHLYVSVSFIITSILAYISTMIYSIYFSAIDNFSTTVYLASGIVIGIFGFLLLANFFNPKLLAGFNLNKTEVDGVTYYQRPKFNFYCILEWLTLLSLPLVSLVLIINSIVYLAI